MIITVQALVFFRKSLLETLDRLLRPYYSNFFFPAVDNKSDDEESDEQVFAEYDDHKGVVFFPPVYAQRYAAVSDCLMDGRWCGRLEKVVDMGYNDASFIKYLKEIPGIRTILGVDIESTPLRCSSDLLRCKEIDSKREEPLQINLFQGNAADPDYHLIGCDGVVAIEMIEHMLPHDLERLVHNVFGFIKPWVVVFTTPNADFNVLFKSLESNGLRRLDHFFEWTREQYHDWCSNIVARYPQYTVSCKGIGPGPIGTEHLGCCSQLALFIAKDYEKQQDLNINNLVLVPDLAADAAKSDLTSWDDSETLPDNLPAFPNINESIPELTYSNEQSSMTIVISSSSHIDVDMTSYCDKTSQCNIDIETQRNYLMFNDEDLCFKILIPRKKNDGNKVYLMEDVKCRLNSSTLHVRRFSKTTQSMLEKNKIDPLTNTREVVDKIQKLTKTLNFDKNKLNMPNSGHTIWSNINWGDNAPYWNQYYKTVREYEYPLEATTDEQRILDLISDEIHRLIDGQENEICVGHTEIPISQLMNVVQHITSDVDKVKDILEWNGYEIMDNMVVYSSLVYEDWPLDTGDCADDAACNWDATDVCHSTSVSESNLTDRLAYSDLRLRRALDHKIEKLRTILAKDDAVSSELDKVFCRLMKLVLKNSTGNCGLPPMMWMQRKLLDLLTLSEKAVEKKKSFRARIYSMPVKENGCEIDEAGDMTNLKRYKENMSTKILMKKYLDLVRLSEDNKETVQKSIQNDFITKTGTFGNGLMKGVHVDEDNTVTYSTENFETNEIQEDKVKKYISEDINTIQTCAESEIACKVTSVAAETKYSRATYKKSYRTMNHFLDKRMINENNQRLDIDKKIDKKRCRSKEKLRKKSNKKARRQKADCSTYFKCYYSRVMNEPIYRHTSKKISKRNTKQHPSKANPIPETLIQLCHPDLTSDEHLNDLNICTLDEIDKENFIIIQDSINTLDNTEESFLKNIVLSDEDKVTESLNTVYTSLTNDTSSNLSNNTNAINKSYHFYDKHVANAAYTSQIMFINDINEPSTSTGIKHFKADAQCGSDAMLPPYSVLTAPATSLARLPKIISPNFDAAKSKKENSTELREELFASSMTYNRDGLKKNRTVETGIKIKDVCHKDDSTTMTNEVTVHNAQETVTLPTKAKPINENIEDLAEEIENTSSVTLNVIPKRNIESKSHTSFIKNNILLGNRSNTICIRPKLSCGGVHVHSYKDHQSTIDVFYQGRWQQYVPKPRRKQHFTALKGNQSKRKITPKESITAKRKFESKAERSRLFIQNMNVTTTFKKDCNKGMRKEIITAKERHINYSSWNNLDSKTYKKKDNKSDNRGNNKVGLSSVDHTSKPRLPVRTLTKHTEKITINNATLTEYNNKIKKNDHKRNIEVPTYKRYLKTRKSPTRLPNVFIKLRKDKSPIRPTTKKILKSDLIKKGLTYPIVNTIKQHNSYIILQNQTEHNKNKQVFYNNSIANNSKRKTLGTTRNPVPNVTSSSICSTSNVVSTARNASTKTTVLAVTKYFSTQNKKILVRDLDNDSSTVSRELKKLCNDANKSEGSKLCPNVENRNNVLWVGIKNSVPGPNENPNLCKQECTTERTFAHKTDNCHLSKIINGNKILCSNSRNRHKDKMPEKSQYSLNSHSGVIPNVDHMEKAKTQVDNAHSAKTISLVRSRDTNVNIKIAIEHFKISIDTKKSIDDRNKMICNVQNPINIPKYSNSKISSTDNEDKLHDDIRSVIAELINTINSSECLINPSSNTIENNDGKNKSNCSINASKHNPGENHMNDCISSKERNDKASPNEKRELAKPCFFKSDSTIIPPELKEQRLDLTNSATTASRLSEYYLADTEFANEDIDSTSDNVIVKDIFERKEKLAINRNCSPGILAMQTFSGFSMDTETVVGDRSDFANLIDSETGSMAVNVARQVASEELFVSGHSSGSYESCQIEEDSVIPDWLFRIISQQTLDEADEHPLMVPMQLPIVEPIFDVNGNLVVAGAGDGRGVHSDNSNDASSQNTTTTSSNTSSGPRSATFVLDPVTFAAEYQPLGDGRGLMNTHAPPSNAMNTATASLEVQDREARSNSRSRSGRAMATSDVDADVSSLDTDN